MTFAIGAKVVYPNHGVSVVENIGELTFDGVEQVFYHLRLLSNNSKVMIPEENLDLVGLRPLGTKAEIQTLFDILEDGNIDTYKDWKGRYKQNLDKMKTGYLIEVAEVLKNLCLVSQKKSLSFREKKMYELAKYFIVSEVAHVRDITESEAETQVEAALQRSLERMKANAEATDGEDAEDKAAAKVATESEAAKPAKKPAAKKAAAKKPAAKKAAATTDEATEEAVDAEPPAAKKAAAKKPAAKKAAAKKPAAKKPAAKKAAAKKPAAKKPAAKKPAAKTVAKETAAKETVANEEATIAS